MRVAIDTSFLHYPPSGIGAYVEALIANLPAADPALELATIEPTAGDLPGLSDPRVRRLLWDAVGAGRAAGRTRPDLLHIPHFAAPVRSPVPFVVTVHDAIPFQEPAYRASRSMRAYLDLMRRNVRAARLVFVPSHAAAADVTRELGIPVTRIRVTPEATSLSPAMLPLAAERAAILERHGITGPYVFNIGGFDARKNLPLLVEAFAEALPDLPPDTALVIAGAPHSANPTVFPTLGPVISRLGLRDRVVLTGRVTESEKATLYAGASCYVTPSLREGFGLTALEAMALGTPTIVANRGSLPEVVGDAGVVVEPTRDDLASALAGLIGDPVRRQRLAEAGPDRAATFSWRHTAELTVRGYREALGLPAPDEEDA